MKSAKEWAKKIAYEVGDDQLLHLKGNIELIQADALRHAHEIVMDDAIIYPGDAIQGMIDELERNEDGSSTLPS